MNVVDLLESTKIVAGNTWKPRRTLSNKDGCCILGCLGIARFGMNWEPSYQPFEQDPLCAAAVELLAKNAASDAGGDHAAAVYTHNDDKFESVEDVQGFIDLALAAIGE
jgi:formate dehydrogenase assembly factor FdhD